MCDKQKRLVIFISNNILFIIHHNSQLNKIQRLGDKRATKSLNITP